VLRLLFSFDPDEMSAALNAKGDANEEQNDSRDSD